MIRDFLDLQFERNKFSVLQSCAICDKWKEGVPAMEEIAEITG